MTRLTIAGTAAALKACSTVYNHRVTVTVASSAGRSLVTLSTPPVVPETLPLHHLTPSQAQHALDTAKRTSRGHMIRLEKVYRYATYRNMAGSRAIFVVQANNQPAAEYELFKRDFEKQGYSVARVKNGLFRAAMMEEWTMNGTEAEALANGFAALLTGPTILIWSSASDAVKPALIQEFAKTANRYKTSTLFVGAKLDGALLTVDTFAEAVKLPSLRELRQQVLGLLSAPGQTLAGLLQQVPQSLVGALTAHVALASSSSSPNGTPSSSPSV